MKPHRVRRYPTVVDAKDAYAAFAERISYRQRKRPAGTAVSAFLSMNADGPDGYVTIIGDDEDVLADEATLLGGEPVPDDQLPVGMIDGMYARREKMRAPGAPLTGAIYPPSVLREDGRLEPL